jgi:hypothetical protein
MHRLRQALSPERGNKVKMAGPPEKGGLAFFVASIKGFRFSPAVVVKLTCLYAAGYLSGFFTGFPERISGSSNVRFCG